MAPSAVLAAFVGEMKVEALARLVDLNVGELVALVLEQRAPVRMAGGARVPAAGGATLRPRADRAAAPLDAPIAPPDLADMLGRTSYRQIHTAVDRWYVNSVTNEERRNVSRVARRLRVSRKRVRGLWARLGATRGQEDAHERKRLGEPSNAPPPPSLAVLLPHGTYREVHDTVDRWLLGHTLAKVGGNVSRAARDLAVSRKHLRDHLARVR